jgi:Ca-activated chloride channel homolog
MRMRLCTSLFAICLLVLTNAVRHPARAQERGAITGTVVDQAGIVLPRVTVKISGPEERSTMTDDRGRFTFANVLPGSYLVQCELVGFRTFSQSVAISRGGSARIAAQLIVGALEETVTVTGESPRRQTSRSALASPSVPADVGGARAAARADHPYYYPPPRPVGSYGAESYNTIDENPFRRVAADPLSTFSIDVDTASYANVRRFLTGGSLPPEGAVRIEELVNYFRFDYPQPKDNVPFSVTTELAECPWNPKHRLALIGLQGRQMPERELPARNLVFLIDVSGSMSSADKLPLVRSALRLFAGTLTARDRVAIVVYAGATGLVLPSTRGSDTAAIDRAIAELEAGGSTNGGAGIELAYRLAREQFIRGGVNRVILATDGDFNVGITSHDALIRLIEHERASGVFLSVLGVGTGNLKDSVMEQLADKGNGNYSYLDSLQEARKVLVEEAGGTLVTIAKDVKLQVEFNPQTVSAYRLIGYENRMLKAKDFNDDTKDAGEIGAGHTVTALYEIVPAGVALDRPAVDPLKYQPAPIPPARMAAPSSDDLLTVKLRYKAPDADESRLIAVAMSSRPQALTANLGFASAVAEVGMLLRESTHAPAASFASAIARARKFRASDPEGYRAEFVKLAELASGLQKLQRPLTQDGRER